MSIAKPRRIGGIIGSVPRTTSGVYGLTKLSEVSFPFAIGGDTYTYAQDGKYWRCHMFSQVGSDTLTFLRGGLVEYLVVGGGGAGGKWGGGGGAGGFRTGFGFMTAAGNSYAVTVGGGGGGGDDPFLQGGSGSSSSFAGIVSSGGGGGGGSNVAQVGGDGTGASGGSGGGGGGRPESAGGSGNAGGFSPSEGNDGGNGNRITINANEPGGGGGGAGAAGVRPTSGVNPDGGIGAQSAISGASLYYAGGGGGGVYAGPLRGAGGLGGGASAPAGIGIGNNGVASTGGGGSGSTGNNASAVAPGGSGGSGIVIVRYQITQAEYEGDEPYYDNVSLLLHMDGTNGSTTFTDSSKHRHAVTANGDAQISTAVSKFGGASAAFDGSGDYLSVPDDASLRLGSGDFTVESWIYITSYSVGYGSPINSWAAAICAKDGFTNRSYNWTITGTASSYTAITFKLFENDSTQTSTTASHTFSLNTWYHVAAVRFGTSLRLYVNGVDVGGGANSVNAADTTTPLFVGTINYDGGTTTTRYQYWFPGYIDDLRITKGVARYTSNFTPPQRELLPNILAGAAPSGLLDQYTGAAAAYSLRSLADGYTGPVVTVRRSSDSAEADFTATEVSDGTLEAWCGAGDGLVKTLYDQSGHGRHASQSTATAQPKIVSGGVLVLENGLPAIEFAAASTHLLQISDGGDFDGIRTGALSYFACAKLDSRLRWQQIFGTGANASDGEGSLGLQFFSNTANKFGPHNTDIAVTQVATLTLASDTNRMLVSMHRNGAGSGGGNGATVTLHATDSSANVRQASGTQTWASHSGTTAFIGKHGDASRADTDAWVGTIQELIIYPVDQSANRIAIEDNINSHYNVFDPTVLLLHMDGTNGSTTFTDSSLNNFAVTANGDAQISTAQSKFGGASAAFDGTGDYLTSHSNGIANFGVSDFTIELWLYWSGSSTQYLLDTRSGSSSSGILLGLSGGVLTYRDNAAVQIEDTTAFPTGVWVHVAVCRASDGMRMFKNGTQVGSTYLSTVNLTDDQFLVGVNNFFTNYITGYIDDLRITKGRALYTANFTPPTQAHPDPVPADPYFNQVSLLLPMDGADGSNTFVDKSKNAFAVTPYGDASISTTQSKFGGASAAFDGAGDYLSIADSDNWHFGTGDFTVEAWIRLSTLSGQQTIVSQYLAAGNQRGWLLDIFNNSGTMKLRFSGTPDGGNTISSFRQETIAPSINQWYHVAVCRESGLQRMFFDGVELGTANDASFSFFNASRPLLVGAIEASGPGEFFNGYIDDLRITKGIARYTSTFTPPTSPHPHM